MKEIYWKHLSLFEKIIFCLGWLSVGNLIFWIAVLLKKFQFPGPVAQKELVPSIHRKSQSVYQKLFNPDTYKVVYVFGWINLIGVLFLLIFLLVIVFFISLNVKVNPA